LIARGARISASARAVLTRYAKGVVLAVVTPADVDRLVEVLRPFRRVLILVHDNPDPDALAAAVALRIIIKAKADTPALVGYSGFLTRPENREMVSVLRLPVHPIDEIDLRRFRAIILVDTQPSAGNNRLSPGQLPTAVVDHHNLRRATASCPYYLVDRAAGATSTIAYEMMKAAGVRPRANISTALFFGIKTDTLDLGREASARDVDAYRELFHLAVHRKLALITHPRLPGEYYLVLHRSVEQTLLYGDCAYTSLGPVSTPEYVSAVADYIAALEGLRWAVATGLYGQNLYFSLRTLTARKDAGKILRRAIGKFGFAGGHQKIAGGLLLRSSLPENDRPLIEAKVVSVLLGLLGANTPAQRPLLSVTAPSDAPAV